MSMQQTTGLWLAGDSWQPLRCLHDNTIHEMQQITHREDLPRFIPAPVDLHVHGGGGADVMQGLEAMEHVLVSHARQGTGALLATSVTAPPDDIDRFLADVDKLMHNPPEEGAMLLGAHLEGPFINPDKLGAQPPYATRVDEKQLDSWLSSGVVKIITYAPEQDPDNVVASLCSHYGVKAQLGHTLCTWSQALQVIKAGAGVTHLFNAMSGVSHRDGGAAAAALAYSDYAEIITDGIHVDKAAFDLAHRAIPFLYSVTDATAAAGMPDGHYELGSLRIEKKGNSVILPDGTLAGSCLTQLTSLAVMANWGLSWLQISRLCSAYPAQWVGSEQLGRIGPGAIANWLELHDNKVAALWLNGHRREIGEHA
ncbi:MAG: N-acetylglucosamine-6-phosphate deacetylase [Granulosicoccus sp.]